MKLWKTQFSFMKRWQIKKGYDKINAFHGGQYVESICTGCVYRKSDDV